MPTLILPFIRAIVPGAVSWDKPVDANAAYRSGRPNPSAPIASAIVAMISAARDAVRPNGGVGRGLQFLLQIVVGHHGWLGDRPRGVTALA